MQIRILGDPGRDHRDFSWDEVLRKAPRPWYRSWFLPFLLALLLPVLGGSQHKTAPSLGGNLTDQELWNKRLAFVNAALHKVPTQETLATFQRLWKLSLKPGREKGEGILFSLLYLESCWRKEGFPSPIRTLSPPQDRFPRAYRFSRFLARIEG
ncbi:MAG TPA: hypothetical protein ENK02_08035 [Planctomycetes bacterium]|nr:hypothetical protein [Planctomycetota bacterium]